MKMSSYFVFSLDLETLSKKTSRTSLKGSKSERERGWWTKNEVLFLRSDGFVVGDEAKKVGGFSFFTSP